jgi:hypothetical protein
MKFKVLFVLTFLINVLLAFSQDEGDDFIPSNEITKSSDCSGSSDAFLYPQKKGYHKVTF